MLHRMALLLLLIGVAGRAAAHESLPVLLSVQQKGADLYLLQLTLPPSIPDVARPDVVAPASCHRLGAPSAADRQGHALYRCPGGMGGATLRFAFPSGPPAVPILTRVAWLSGESRTLLASPGTSTVILPVPESARSTARQYISLGLRHVLTGFDHLLFLLCLMIIAGSRRRVLLTVTGFTLGHATTITAVALGAAGLPSAPVETAIALSIMFLAAEILRPRRETLTWRYPVAVSSCFGLLHGFGFAAALGEAGLPQTEAPIALLSFNIGIETGQLLFVGLCAGAWQCLHLARRRSVTLATAGPAMLQQPLAYAIGSVSALWFIERLANA